MPSQFPGMNPYLEQPAAWRDFHQSFLPLLRNLLVELVRPSYVVKLEEERIGRVPPRSERHAFLEIRDRQGLELVTVIELLSPSNKKPGPDREQYLAERREILASSAHLVELDLLRGGPRLPAEGLPDCDYCVLISRADERPRVGIWPLRLRETLPEIPIPLPLRAPSPDVRVDLQKVLHRLYDEAGYGDYIYLGKPQPPLHPTDAVWAAQFVPSQAAAAPSGQ